MTSTPDSLTVTGFNAHLGMTLADVGPDLVTATIEIDGEHLQPAGIVHGGVYCAIIETLASVGGGQYFSGPGRSVVGVNNSTDFIRAVGAGSVLTAEATPIHRGRTQQLWQVEIVGPDNRLVSRGTVRLANLESREDHPSKESRNS
ncbi:PaaI family thioesterase [Rhodococcus artemisiae]|uniref:PaaI family thioesterase n=1 Tax=Rhodococcus artemisiae TaxID=714159 RepID=A0ABU7L6V1_9NOCA|nr:PaaI family thioesterase [Rhodococcus artemisiae]MEE2057253.1 PaaI family thioesterase [Rhodococcus artemisiae]